MDRGGAPAVSVDESRIAGGLCSRRAGRRFLRGRSKNRTRAHHIGAAPRTAAGLYAAAMPDRPGLLGRTLREPLVHFLLAGAALYGLYRGFSPTRGAGDSRRIEVTTE